MQSLLPYFEHNSVAWKWLTLPEQTPSSLLCAQTAGLPKPPTVPVELVLYFVEKKVVYPHPRSSQLLVLLGGRVSCAPGLLTLDVERPARHCHGRACGVVCVRE